MSDDQKLDWLTVLVLAAQHPATCVRDYDDDVWHVGCLVERCNEFNQNRGVHLGPSSLQTHRITLAVPGPGEECYAHRTLTHNLCPTLGPMVNRVGEEWTS